MIKKLETMKMSGIHNVMRCPSCFSLQGISLSVDQWKKLKEIIPKVDKAIS